MLQRIQERGKVIIGLQKDYQPFHIEDAKVGYPGIDVEIGELLAATLRVQAEFRFLHLAELMEAADKGEIDLALGGVSSSLERGRLVNFTLPYVVTTPAGLLSRSVLPPDTESSDFPRRDFKSLADLRFLGKLIIGVRGGTTNEAILRESPELAKHTIEVFSDRYLLIQALKDRKIDVMVADGVHINSLLLKHSALLSNFLPLTERFREEHISMVLGKGDVEFWNYMNFFVREIRRSGRLGAILKKYFEGDEWIKK